VCASRLDNNKCYNDHDNDYKLKVCWSISHHQSLSACTVQPISVEFWDQISHRKRCRSTSLSL